MPFALPLAATAAAAAAPAAAAAATSASLSATLVSVASQAAVSMAINAAMSVLSPKVGAAGRPVDWTLDPNGPIPFALGRVGVAGAVINKGTFGPDKMNNGFVSVLSGAGPIDGYESFWADDRIMSFDANGKCTTAEWAGELFRVSNLGAQPANWLPSPIGLKNNSTIPNWSSAHRASGKALSQIVMVENSKNSAFPNGEIKPREVLRGLKCWDPRFDSTYPGGSGPQRLDNAATWVWSQNPIILALRWTLGLWEDAVGKGVPFVGQQVGGIGSKLSGIDVPTFVAAANICDANFWTAAAYPNTDDDKHQVLVSLLQAAGAIYAQRAGKISLIQRGSAKASVATITADDVVGPIEVDTAASRIDRINTIQPSYWSSEHRWQMTALPEVTAQAYRDADGGKRSRGISYSYVTNANQAAQLAALEIAHSREGMAGQVALKPYLQRIKPGDTFVITEPGFLLDGAKCLCMSTEYDPAEAVVRVTFVSETDAKYAFALGQSTTPPAPPTLVAPNNDVTPPAPNDWEVVVIPPSPDGTQLPGFLLEGLVSNSMATAVIVEWGSSATGPWTQAYSGPPNVTTIPIVGVQPGGTYWLAVRYQINSNFSDRYIDGPYTAPLLIADDVTPTSPVWAGIDARVAAALVGYEGPDLEALRLELEADIAAADGRAQAAEALITGRLNDLGIDDIEGLAEFHVDIRNDLGTEIGRIDGLQAQSEALLGRITDLDLITLDLDNDVGIITGRTTLIESEITGGRNGASSLAARLLADRTAAATATGAVASDLDLVEAEVFAGRDGTSTLNARMLRDRQAAVTDNAARVTDLSVLTARRQGIRNLVRKAAFGADVLDTITWGEAGWGLRIVGNGTLQSRAASVAPLAQNTPYSLSFRARVTAGSATGLVIDLFPDTLPQTSRTITTTAQTFVWEGITSANADMASAVLRFFDSVPSGRTIEITDVVLVQGAVAPLGFIAALEDGYVVTNELQGRTTSLDAITLGLGTDLGVVSGRTTAIESEINGARGGSTNLAARLLTDRNAAVTATGAVATDLDLIEAEIASARGGQPTLSGRVQQLSQAIADESGARAAAITTVSAQATTRGNLIKNSTGSLGLAHFSGSAGWSVATDQLFGPRFVNGSNGTLALQQVTADAFEAAPSAWYTMQADLRRTATAGGIYMDIAWLRANGTASTITPFSTRIGATSNREFGSVDAIEVQAPSDAARGVVRFFMESITGNGGCGVRRAKVERGRLPATGWTDDRTDQTLAGTVTTVQTAQLDAENRLSLVYGFALNNNGRVSGMYAADDGAVSTLNFEFDVFNIWSGSTTVPAFAVAGGNVYLGGNLARTESLVANAVTKAAGARTAGQVVVNNTGAHVQTCALSTAGGQVRVDYAFNLFATNTSVTAGDILLEIFRDGSLIFSSVAANLEGSIRVNVRGPDAAVKDDYIDIPGYLNRTVSGFFFDAAPSAGSHSYQMWVSTTRNVRVSERNLFLLETKR